MPNLTDKPRAVQVNTLGGGDTLADIIPGGLMYDFATAFRIVKEMSNLAQRVTTKRGALALVSTEKAVAYHEAGHAVVAAAHGFGVKRVWIKRKWMEQGERWSGGTHLINPDGSRYIEESRPDSAVTDDLDFARNTIAGFAAQLEFDAEDLRWGSLDEIVMFGHLVANVAAKTGAPMENIQALLFAQLQEILRRETIAVETIAAELRRRGGLRGGRLTRLLQDVRLMRPEGRGSVEAVVIRQAEGEFTVTRDSVYPD